MEKSWGGRGIQKKNMTCPVCRDSNEILLERESTIILLFIDIIPLLCMMGCSSVSESRSIRGVNDIEMFKVVAQV